ncbi:hypothetical protein PspLS_02302 [Pyricularia sp. CBS 133598]|nr:hypothetical protein PspLS_02302 [Pyricularia sp. CBS 133598]
MFGDNFLPTMATMAALSGLALAVENFKPTVKPMPFNMYGMDKDLRLHMPPMSISDIKVESWIPGKIPYTCFNGEGLEGTFAMTTINPWEFHVFNVTFKDCDRSWVVCRHYNAGATELEVVKGISAMPVGIREAISVFTAVPLNMPGGVAAWVHDGDTMVVQDPIYWSSPYLLMHEATHALDWTTLSPAPFDRFWSYGDEWRAAIESDGVVPSVYAANAAGPEQFNLREDFAEVGGIALYDLNVPGGIEGFHKNASAISAQLALYKKVVGEARIVKGGSCSAAKAEVRRIVDIAGFKDDDVIGEADASRMAAHDLMVPPVEPLLSQAR